MINKVRKRLDAFSLALGGVAAKSPYVGLQIVPDDRINAAWDARLRQEARDHGPDAAPDGACTGWAT